MRASKTKARNKGLPRGSPEARRARLPRQNNLSSPGQKLASAPPAADAIKAPTPNAAADPSQAVELRASFILPKDPLDQAQARATAKFAMQPHAAATEVVNQFVAGQFGKQDRWALAEELEASMDRVRAGDLGQGEAMLMGMAIALQSMFTHMARRVLTEQQQHYTHTEAYFGMAMKAQNQCRMTLETLGELKNPRSPTFIRAGQANVTSGAQQVNNGAEAPPESRARKVRNRPNKLLEGRSERMDRRETGAPGGADSALAAVATVHRSQDD
jgi:hypothetical protein